MKKIYSNCWGLPTKKEKTGKKARDENLVRVHSGTARIHEISPPVTTSVKQKIIYWKWPNFKSIKNATVWLLEEDEWRAASTTHLPLVQAPRGILYCYQPAQLAAITCNVVCFNCIRLKCCPITLRERKMFSMGSFLNDAQNSIWSICFAAF